MNELVYLRHEEAMTDSLMVAEKFNKRHDNVLKDRRELECSEEFRLLNFEETRYKKDIYKDCKARLETVSELAYLRGA